MAEVLPDIVFLDLGVTELDGYEVARGCGSDRVLRVWCWSP